MKKLIEQLQSEIPMGASCKTSDKICQYLCEGQECDMCGVMEARIPRLKKVCGINEGNKTDG